MARQLRLEYEGALYHITSRGNAQAAIYLDKDNYLLELCRDIILTPNAPAW